MGQGNQSPIGNTGISGPSPVQQMAQPGTNAAIAPYYTGAGATGQEYEQMVGKEYGQMQNFGKSIAPTFDTMFSKYVDVANREAGKQASQIGETLGSRGALYSSANLQQQANMRQQTSQDIANTAAQYQTQLENQRQSAEQIRQTGMQNVMQNQAGLATAEHGAREAAMARAYQDFLRRSDVPPL